MMHTDHATAFNPTRDAVRIPITIFVTGDKFLPAWLAIVLALAIAYARQVRRQGGLSKTVARELDRLSDQTLRGDRTGKAAVLTVLLPRSGTILVREWQGTSHHVTVVDGGFLWNGKTYRSLSGIARAITGTSWNGPRFFGMRDANGKTPERDNG